MNGYFISALTRQCINDTIEISNKMIEIIENNLKEKKNIHDCINRTEQDVQKISKSVLNFLKIN